LTPERLLTLKKLTEQTL